jgi:hypothetical protein
VVDDECAVVEIVFYSAEACGHEAVDELHSGVVTSMWETSLRLTCYRRIDMYSLSPFV